MRARPMRNCGIRRSCSWRPFAVCRILFLTPMLLPITGLPFVAEVGIAAWLVMAMVYMPMIRFYELPLVWALALPVASIIYILATIDSGRLYWQGRGGEWKGRTQA